MRNPTGTPIWYELLSDDSDASKKFYEHVLGWKVAPPAPESPHDYRMIDAEKGKVGGMMQLDDNMRKGGAKPTWLFYVGVDDVDAAVKKVEEAGGSVLLKPFDIPNAGRAAMIADPQGIPLYVMRGSTDEPSRAFEREGMGKCNWHELATPDQPAALAFYEKVFGWTYPEKMPMPGMGDYVFVDVAGTRIAGAMTKREGQPSGWSFYFRVPDIDVAAERVKSGGGRVHAGPMDVPGGDRVIVASDPQGAPFGVSASAKPAS